MSSTFGDVAPNTLGTPGLRAGLSFMWSRLFPHLPAPLPTADATFADEIQHRKRSRFVLSSKKAEIAPVSAQTPPFDSCFRVGKRLSIRAFG